MARPRTSTPQMYLHKSSSTWCVNLSGKRVRLGRDRTAAEEKYRRTLAGWWQGRPEPGKLPAREGARASEVLLAYRVHAARTVSRSQLARIDYATRAVLDLYGSTPATDFDQLALQAVREHLLRQRSRRGKSEQPFLSRNYVNALIGCVQTAWAWAARQKLVPGSAVHDLRTVKALREEEGGREVERVRPANPADVAATLPHCTPTVAALVQIQCLTGMRPGEAVILRRADISCSPAEKVQPPRGPAVAALEVDGQTVWVYAPRAHKTLRSGKVRLVALGPQAQAVLLPFLTGRAPDAYLFSPREAVEAWHKAAGRKSPEKKSRVAGERYTTQTYTRAVKKAARRAGVPVWSANTLRHAAATEITFLFDQHAAQAVLGHANPDMTATYISSMLKKAAAVAAKIG